MVNVGSTAASQNRWNEDGNAYERAVIGENASRVVATRATTSAWPTNSRTTYEPASTGAPLPSDASNVLYELP